MNLELSFDFSETEEHKQGKIIDNLEVKKATCVDKMILWIRPIIDQ